MTGNGKKKFKLREETVVKFIIAAPIVIILLVVGGPAIWKGIASIAKVIFPNFWVIMVYLYIAVVGFFVGKKIGNKSKK